MEDVFSQGLADAKHENVLAGYLTRELLRFPVDLVKVYAWSMQANEGRQVAISGVGNGSSGGVSMPQEGWGASLMAGLPHLLIALTIIGSEIIYGILCANQDVSGLFPVIALSILILGVVLYGHFNGWKSWSASWLIYIFGIGLTLLSVIANALPHTVIEDSNLIYEIQVFAIPLLLAYVLYKIACKDRLRGLLASIPAAAIIWMIFLEFVPSLQKSLALGWIFLLAFTASVLMVRVKRFSTALLLAMAVPILGGFPFVYLGVYMGGTLPFTEPGPSIAEVFRQYLPFLATSLTLIFGPQLAVKLRVIGSQYAKEGGKTFYRLALGGILLGLLFSFTQFATLTSGVNVHLSISKGLLVISIILFLVGFLLLLWTAHHNKLPSSDNSDTVELAALFFPLLFVPLVLILVLQVLQATYSESWLRPLIEMVWVGATALAIKD
jgi:hypothetical protein